jgi:hypothetical protein
MPTSFALETPARGRGRRVRSSASVTRFARWTIIAALSVAAGAMSGCREAPVARYTQRESANRLAGDLRVAFNRAADAANRAVMADTDEASVAFARDAEGARQTVRRDADALTPLLRSLGYTDEVRLLADFGGHFAEYEALDREVLTLAVENTNLKAQRLSYGPARAAADAFTALAHEGFSATR